MTEPETYTVSRAHMEAFGVIVQWFARHETLLQIAMAGLLNARLDGIVALTVGLGYRGKHDAFVSLTRFIDMPLDQAERLRSFARELDSYSALRNAIAHRTWKKGERPNSIKSMAMDVRGGKLRLAGIGSQEPDYLFGELQQKADELAGLYNRFNDYLDEIGLLRAVEAKL